MPNVTARYGCDPPTMAASHIRLSTAFRSSLDMLELVFDATDMVLTKGAYPTTDSGQPQTWLEDLADRVRSVPCRPPPSTSSSTCASPTCAASGILPVTTSCCSPTPTAPAACRSGSAATRPAPSPCACSRSTRCRGRSPIILPPAWSTRSVAAFARSASTGSPTRPLRGHRPGRLNGLRRGGRPPSDALALALVTGAPIRVDRGIVETVEASGFVSWSLAAMGSEDEVGPQARSRGRWRPTGGRARGPAAAVR